MIYKYCCEVHSKHEEKYIKQTIKLLQKANIQKIIFITKTVEKRFNKSLDFMRSTVDS